MIVQTLPSGSIISVRGCRHEDRSDPNMLTLHWVRGGRKEIRLGPRSVIIDDDTYFIVNAGCSYETRFASPASVRSLAVCFRAGLAERILERMEDGAAALYPISFFEHLQVHDNVVSPVLRFIESHLDQGVADDRWYDEHLRFLLERMLRKQQQLLCSQAAVNAVRPATRCEIFRRVSLAADYIHSNYEKPITLADIAAAAALSPHHLLRLFKLVHGCTPRDYLQSKRTRMATRLIEHTDLTLAEIAHRVGFEDRGTLSRRVRRTYGLKPRQLRLAPGVPGRAA